jgi:hypothetical protein
VREGEEMVKEEESGKEEREESEAGGDGRER